MGLDQYLYAKCYTSPSDWLGKERNELFDTIVKATGAEEFMTKESPSACIDIKVGYWRKANQIHQWFVDNCQNGEDDCREAFVRREQLIELRDLCEKVLADHSLADELLPTQSGFFFGNTEYDEWYFNDVQETVLIINNALTSVPAEYDFAYGSSW
jgi:hypothetical protein